jgi:hypothetical protein
VLQKGGKQLLHHLDLVLRPRPGLEAAVANFAAHLFRALGYHDLGLIFIGHTLPFDNCGQTLLAQTDVCIMDEDCELILLLQEDQKLWSMKDPEPQIVATAIAAFSHNNRLRAANGYHTRDSITFPCVTMSGTFPIFYKITVNSTLSNAVISGTYPITETIVTRFVPPLPRQSDDSMGPLDNRRELVLYFEAFKTFLAVGRGPKLRSTPAAVKPEGKPAIPRISRRDSEEFFLWRDA